MIGSSLREAVDRLSAGSGTRCQKAVASVSASQACTYSATLLALQNSFCHLHNEHASLLSLAARVGVALIECHFVWSSASVYRQTS